MNSKNVSSEEKLLVLIFFIFGSLVNIEGLEKQSFHDLDLSWCIWLQNYRKLIWSQFN